MADERRGQVSHATLETPEASVGSLSLPLEFVFVTAGEILPDAPRRGQVAYASLRVPGSLFGPGAVSQSFTFGFTTVGRVPSQDVRRGTVSYTSFRAPGPAPARGRIAFPLTVGYTTNTRLFGRATVSTQLQFSVRTGSPRIAASGLVFLFGDGDPLPGISFGRLVLPISVNYSASGVRHAEEFAVLMWVGAA